MISQRDFFHLPPFQQIPELGDQHQNIIKLTVCALGFCIVVDFNVYLTKYTNLIVLYQHTVHRSTAICLLISSNIFEISFR
jgi:hypothetical protein